MDLDRVVRIAALALIPALGVGLWLARSPSPGPDGANADSASDIVRVGAARNGAKAASAQEPLGLPATGATSELGKAVSERGEAALAQRDDATRAQHDATRAQRDATRAQHDGTRAQRDGTPTPESDENKPATPKVRPIPKRHAGSTARRAAVDLPLAVNPVEISPRHGGGSGKPVRPRRDDCGGIEARAITASPDPEWAFASLSPAPGESAKLRRVGDRIGGYRVDAIEWDRVWLAGGGGRCAAVLHQVVLQPGTDAPGLEDDGDGATEPWRLGRELAHAIEERGDGRFVVDDGVLDGLFARGTALLSGITLTPRVTSETVRGVAIEGVREGSLLGHLGVENGDVLVRLADVAPSTSAAIADALKAARRERRLLATLERAGKARELSLVARSVAQ